MISRIQSVVIAAGLLIVGLCDGFAADWQPAPWKMMTRWAKDVSPEKVLPEYPRPQMVRQEWRNLNGLWDFRAERDRKSEVRGQIPESYDRKILVPFPMESALSGIRETAEFVWYRRTFDVPVSWKGKRILLHFGAVDWEATVYVNGKDVGKHRGGYDPFSFDITDALKSKGPQEVMLGVVDRMEGQAAGKQSKNIFLKPQGSIFYSCVTGIWQPVWLEAVPAGEYIKGLKITPDVDGGSVGIEVTSNLEQPMSDVQVSVLDGGRQIAKGAGKAGEKISIKISDPKLWSPDSPNLYDLKIKMGYDEVGSYFAMRKISIGKDERGITRILLNNKFTFMMGSLDQGFWPDGIYTAPTDEALRFDIEFAKRIGLNLARKHVKIESDRWYYWCDKLGLLVWQDMPSFSPGANYGEEMPHIITALQNHPCIIAWVMMNEGYPSREQQEMAVALARKYDPTRLVTATSGWRDMGFGDIMDRHDYPGPSSPIPEEKRAAVLGECGYTYGYVHGHDWMEAVLHKDYKPWYSNSQKLDLRHEKMLRQMWRYVYTPGLSGAAWTQLTDIEGESNGFITYDREVIKNDVERIVAANKGFVSPIMLPDVTATDDVYLFADSQEVSLIAPHADAQIRFTLDGSEPTAQSTLYAKPILMKESTTIKAVTLWPKRSQSATSVRLYRKVTEFEPSVVVENLQPGVAWQYMEDDKVLDSGVIDHFTFRPNDLYVKNPKEKGRFVWTSYIRVPHDGVYTFQRSASNMTLAIGNVTLFTSRGGLGDKEETAQVALKAGLHRIEAKWIQLRNGYYSLDCAIHVEGPAVAQQPIPSTWLKCEAKAVK